MKSVILSLLLFSASVQAQHVLYLYGDVSAEGDVPSGDKEPFHQMLLTDTGKLGLSQFAKALEAVGLTIDQAYDGDTALNAATLKDIDVLILASNQRMFRPDEATAVKLWVEQGGGLVAWSDSAFGGHYRLAGINNTLGRDSDNVIMQQFGMYLLTDNGAGNYLIHQYTENHFINNNNKNAGILFRGEGVSFVRTTPPARILAKAQNGGLGGGLRVSKVDAPFNPDTDAALSVAEVGQGRVVGLFDRNMLWNAGAGTRLSHVDNREFCQRLVLWAAGVEDNSRIPAQDPASKDERNVPPVLHIEHRLADDGQTLHVTARIEDNDTDSIEPEIEWSVQKGSPKAHFENNNLNVLSPVITLTKPGKYTFIAQLKDGSYKLRKIITVTRE